MKSIEVRLAQNEDGEDIRRLARYTGFELSDLDWGDIYPYWLVAELDGGILGCLQICPGKPFGFLELFFVDPGLSQQCRARVLKAVMDQGFQTLKQSGTQVIICMVPFENKALKRILKKRDFTVVASGNFLGKRLI